MNLHGTLGEFLPNRARASRTTVSIMRTAITFSTLTTYLEMKITAISIVLTIGNFPLLTVPCRNRYLILDVLGQGTFGQVVKCQNLKTQEVVAVKVVKNRTAYFNQSMMEVSVLDLVCPHTHFLSSFV